LGDQQEINLGEGALTPINVTRRTLNGFSAALQGLGRGHKNFTDAFHPSPDEGLDFSRNHEDNLLEMAD
jgi:hypothetical protein